MTKLFSVPHYLLKELILWVSSLKTINIVYRKTDGLEVDCYVLFFLKYGFNLNHMTKVSPQTFARGCKKTYSAGKNLTKNLYWYWRIDIINRKYFKLILKMTILVKCIGKFCYGDGVFQNTEVGTGGVLKNFTKFTGKELCQGLF